MAAPSTVPWRSVPGNVIRGPLSEEPRRVGVPLRKPFEGTMASPARHSPDFHEQPTGKHPRSRTDLNRSGCPRGTRVSTGQKAAGPLPQPCGRSDPG